MNFDTPVADAFSHARGAGEGGVEAAREGELREDFIARDGADVVFDVARVGAGDVPPGGENAGAAPERIAGDETHEVHEVRAEDHEVFAAGALVLFAIGAHFHEVAEEVLFLNGIAQATEVRGLTHGVGDGDFAAGGGGGDDLVGFRGRAGDRLFGINMSAGAEAGEDDFPVLVAVSHADADEVRFFLREHFAVVGVGLDAAESSGGFGAAGFVGIGEGDKLDAGACGEDFLQAVTVVAASGVTDDDGAQRFGFIRRGGEGGGAQGKEVAASHAGSMADGARR